MVFKIRDPKRWFELPVGEVIALEGEGNRPVRLEVNTVAHAAFRVRYPDDKFAFLAAFQGMDVIEFQAVGPCEIWVDSEAEVYFYTDDGRNIAFVDDGKVNFAVPHERRGETDQIIYMQQLMLRNEQRRNALLERALEEERAANANSGGHDQGTVPESQEQPAGDPSADAATEGVAGAETQS